MLGLKWWRRREVILTADETADAMIIVALLARRGHVFLDALPARQRAVVEKFNDEWDTYDSLSFGTVIGYRS